MAYASAQKGEQSQHHRSSSAAAAAHDFQQQAHKVPAQVAGQEQQHVPTCWSAVSCLQVHPQRVTCCVRLLELNCYHPPQHDRSQRQLLHLVPALLQSALQVCQSAGVQHNGAAQVWCCC
jgi:hypothetical protein